jgi:hypothetical protein
VVTCSEKQKLPQDTTQNAHVVNRRECEYSNLVRDLSEELRGNVPRSANSTSLCEQSRRDGGKAAASKAAATVAKPPRRWAAALETRCRAATCPCGYPA